MGNTSRLPSILILACAAWLGSQLPAQAGGNYSISGKVWNIEGTQALSGVQVNIYDSGSKLLGTGITNGVGQFTVSFSDSTWPTNETVTITFSSGPNDTRSITAFLGPVPTGTASTLIHVTLP